MKILTDDPDWAPELYEARALAMTFVRKHGCWQRDAVTFLTAERNGLKVTYYPHRSPLLLTVDASLKAARGTVGLCTALLQARDFGLVVLGSGDPKYSAFFWAKEAHFSGRSSSAKIADTGQTGTQAPQSMHSTGSM